MKKLLMVALVIGLVFSLAQVTVAEDRLKISGDLRLRAFNIDNRDLDDDIDDNAQYFDHRMRIGMTIAVAEGITANTRFDIEDDVVWGDEGVFGRPSSDGSDIEFDRMFVRIEKDMFIFQGGHIFQAFGIPRYASAYSPQSHGLALRIKTPVLIDLNYFKVDEGDSTVDDVDADKDVDAYGLQVQYKADAFTAGAFYAAQVDEDDTTDDNPSVIGLWGLTNIGPVSVKASLDMYGGSRETAAGEVDYIGTQLWLNGEMAFTDMITAGANVYYALGTDDDGEEQIVFMPGAQLKFGGFEPHEMLNYFGQADNLTPLFSDNPFELAANQGVMGFDIYALFGVTPSVKLGAQLGYFSAQEDLDDAPGAWNSSTLIQAGASWTFAPKCELLGGAYMRMDDFEDPLDDTDDEVGMVGILSINW